MRDWTSLPEPAGFVGDDQGFVAGGGSGEISEPEPIPELVSIDVTPNAPSLEVPATQQMTATGTYDDASTGNLTVTATWGTTDAAVATVSAGGLVTAVAEGTATISATVGAIVGSEVVTVTEPAVTVPRDGPLNVYVPATAEHWTARGIAVPDHAWSCQAGSGNLVADIGSLALVPGGTVAYSQAVAGWTRLAVATTETSNSRFSAAAGAGPNPAATSVAWLVYAGFSANGAAREFLMGAESTSDLRLDIFGGATPGFRVNCAGVTSNSVGTGHADGLIRPYLLVYNRTAGTVRAYAVDPGTGTIETISGTYSAAVVDGVKGLGASGGTGPAMRANLAATWSGANAEGLSAATLTALGW